MGLKISTTNQGVGAGTAVANAGPIFTAPKKKVVKENSFVARYELSDRSVIFYTDYFPIQREGSISFEFQATCAFNVTNIHHAAVRVYDYYDPDEECIQFYTGEGSNVVQTLCNDDECTCISREIFHESNSPVASVMMEAGTEGERGAGCLE
ncbi:complement component 3-2 [Apostichopus japonicus]|uniref:Complement component 3-2 n=1 Tax=Stichopus japonicus TaxID=307972 RepID=A0A2G8JNM5_STIJA|nr:complement component 3-2 [Apostichopus japonicus]